MKVPLVCLLLLLIYAPASAGRVGRKLIMSKTSHIKYLTPDNHRTRPKKAAEKLIKKKKERRLSTKAHKQPKKALAAKGRRKERKLFTIVDPEHQKKLRAEKTHKDHQKLIEKMELERKLKKMKSFRVPKGHKPRSLIGQHGKERKTNDDDPTAGEDKIESIPLLLFGDYEIIIEKK